MALGGGGLRGGHSACGTSAVGGAQLGKIRGSRGKGHGHGLSRKQGGQGDGGGWNSGGWEDTELDSQP